MYTVNIATMKTNNQVFISITMNATSSLIGIAVLYTLVRFFNPEDYSRYVYLLSTLSLGSGFAALGIASLSSRVFGTLSKVERQEFSFRTLTYVLLNSFVISLLLTAFFRERPSFFFLVILFVFFKALAAVRLAQLQALGKTFKSKFYYQFLPGAFILLVLLISRSLSIEDLLFYGILSFPITLIIDFRNNIRWTRFSYSKIFLSSYRYGILNILNEVDSRLVLILAGSLSGAENIALLGFAYSVYRMSQVLSNAVNQVNAPLIANSYARKEQNLFAGYVQKSFRLNLLISALILIAFFFSGKLILSYFGEAYQDSFYAIIIFFVISFVSSLFGINGYVLAMTGNERYVIKTQIFGILVFALVGVSLFKIFSIYSLIYAHGLAVIVKNSLNYCYVVDKLAVRCGLF